MKKSVYIFLLTISILLTGCLQPQSTDEPPIDLDNPPGVEEETEIDQHIEGEEEAEPDEPTVEQTAEEVAVDVVMALKVQDMDSLSVHVHPSKGVRFSPYSYVEPQNDLVFSATQIQGLMNDPTIYLWGHYDGTGDPIELTFSDYLARFVYDQDYASPEQIAINDRLGQGNSLDNSFDVYPNSTIIEFHFSGFDPQYAGMDWRSLRIVLEEVNNQWFVVGIIHDKWTI